MVTDAENNNQPQKRAKVCQDFSTFRRLLCQEDLTVFFSDYWEKCYFHQTHNNNTVSKDISFTVDDFWKLCEQNGLKPGSHFNVCRYESDDTQSILNDQTDIIVLKQKWKEDNLTIQFFHPQCYSDNIYHTLFHLEEEFNCLWGANVYITPPGAQGLSPHYDDSEVFVFQTEGSKTWYIYENLSMNEKLCLSSSLPLTKDKVGALIKTVVLKPGDMLYLPRGTIHCAKTSNDMHSVHITISTYQRHCYSDLSADLFSSAIQNLSLTDISLRKGLPLQRSKEIYYQTITENFNVILNKVKKSLENNYFLRSALSNYETDFVVSRLPPPRESKVYKNFMASLPNVGLVINDEVKISKLSWFNFVIVHPEGPNEKLHVIIYSCLTNDRSTHMGLTSSSIGEENDTTVSTAQVELDQYYLKFLNSLLSEEKEFTKVTNESLNFAHILNELNALIKK